MTLRENIQNDISEVFMRDDEFAEDHVYNGKVIRCIIDQDADLKRKNNNVLDINWDNNHAQIHLFVGDDQLDARPEINTEVLLDGQSWRVMICDYEMGMYVITLVQHSTRYI